MRSDLLKLMVKSGTYDRDIAAMASRFSAGVESCRERVVAEVEWLVVAGEEAAADDRYGDARSLRAQAMAMIWVLAVMDGDDPEEAREGLLTAL